MMHLKSLELLNRHNLKRTNSREGIIEGIMSANNALSENEIQERLQANNVERSVINLSDLSFLSRKKEHAHTI